MLKRDPALRALRALPGFAELPRKELRMLADAGTEVARGAGDTVIKQGAGAAALHVVLEGTVRIEAGGQVLAQHGPGTLLGEMAFLNRAERSASVIAETDVRLHAVSAWAVPALLQNAPALRALIERTAAGRVGAPPGPGDSDEP